LFEETETELETKYKIQFRQKILTIMWHVIDIYDKAKIITSLIVPNIIIIMYISKQTFTF
jgi:hypothetical protein